jgi:hypothetical protein
MQVSVKDGLFNTLQDKVKKSKIEKQYDFKNKFI